MRPDRGNFRKGHGFPLTGWAWRAVSAWAATIVLIFVAVSCMSPDPETAAPTTTETETESSVTTTTTEPPSPTSTSPAPTATQSPPTTLEPSEFHVSPDGSDDNDGSEGASWATLSHAFLQLRPGDTLFMGGGTYQEQVRIDVTPGTPEEPIVVRGVSGEEPVLEGLLWLRYPDHWVIDGLNVTWDEEANDDKEHMVKLTDGSGWELRNSELWGARSFAALLIAGSEEGAPSDWRVVGNCIHDTIPSNDTNEDQLIYVNTGPAPSNALIENNLLFGAENGSAIKLAGPSEGSGGAHGITVRNNTIINAAQGVLIAWGSSNNVLAGNFFAGTDEGYGHIRGYQLDGEGNVASDNGGDAHEPFILNDEGSTTGVEDGGGNSPGVDVEIPEPSCDSHPDVSGYGLQTSLDAMPTNS